MDEITARFIELANAETADVDLSMGDTSPLGKGPRRLSDAERGIAHALMRKGRSKHDAIRIARGLLKRAAATGTWAGRGRAHASTVAKAGASIAQRHSFANETQRHTLDIALAHARMRDLDFSFRGELHPRDWRGRFATKNSLKGPLDNNGRVVPTATESAKYEAHVRKADSLLIQHGNTLSTDNDGFNGSHVIDENGNVSIQWSEERQKMQKKIVNTVYARAARTAKSDRKALFLGGLPGAGKSTSIKRIPGLNESDYITINPDIFKEELAQRGLTPKLKGLSPMEASAFVHEESSQMALALAAKATAAGKNIIWDITMNKASSVHSRLAPLKDAGYATHSVFVDIPHSMSQKRVEQRHRSGELARMRDTTGTHLGQRLVPSTHVAGGKSKKGSSSANRDAFEEVKHLFDAHKLYDNSGKDPKLLEERGKFKV